MIGISRNYYVRCLLLLYVALCVISLFAMISNALLLPVLRTSQHKQCQFNNGRNVVETIPSFCIGCNNSKNNKRHKLFGVTTRLHALSKKYLENDLVAIQRNIATTKTPTTTNNEILRLCAVSRDGAVIPLCVHLDDVETDLFGDPRQYFDTFWSDDVTDDHVYKGIVFGEGFYGQRPVPSLGGGPGYGAMADEVWSVTIDVLDTIRSYSDENGIKIELPTLDVGIAHGEKARGGSL